MLEDRYYMRRRAPFTPRWSMTVLLLVINGVAFFLQNVLSGSFRANAYLALSVDGLRHGYVWQLLSYQLMHANLFHLLSNCLAIFVFGRDVEEALGRKSFLTLYFSSGVVGGLCQALGGVLLGGKFAAPVVGASAGVFGLVAAFALLFPERVLLLFFIIPMRASFLLWLSAGMALFGVSSQVLGFASSRDNLAHAAHLGGMLSGVIFVRYAIHWHWRWPQLRRPTRQTPRRLVKVSSQKPGLWARNKPEPPEDLPTDEFVSKEVDPILDKISAQGIQSLTEREKRILQAAHDKIAKR